jgi:hypothetical protein
MESIGDVRGRRDGDLKARVGDIIISRFHKNENHSRNFWLKTLAPPLLALQTFQLSFAHGMAAPGFL